MGSSVMSSELGPPILINRDSDLLSLEHLNISWQRFVKSMKHNLADLDSIGNFVLSHTSSNLHNAGIVLLSSRGWVDSRFVQNYNIVRLGFVCCVLEDIDDCGVKLHQLLISVEKHVCLGEMRGGVKHFLRLLGSLLLSISDFGVKIERDGLSSSLGNGVNRDTFRLHAKNPLIDAELSFLFFDHVLQLLDRGLIRVLPSIILNLHDLGETLVWGPLAIDTFKVLLVVLKDLEEAFHAANLVPPSIFGHFAEHDSQNVSDISATTNIRGQGSIGDCKHDSSSMV